MDALKLRKRIKAKKPRFLRSEWHTFKKLRHRKWKKPTGKTNKMRRGRRGKPAMPNPGYSSPKEVRHMHVSGLFEVLVYDMKTMSSIDPKTHGARIASAVGRRKKDMLLKSADELGVTVFNR